MFNYYKVACKKLRCSLYEDCLDEIVEWPPRDIEIDLNDDLYNVLKKLEVLSDSEVSELRTKNINKLRLYCE